MFALLILIVVALVIGYFLGLNKAGESVRNWYAGLRAPKEEESPDDESDSDEQ